MKQNRMAFVRSGQMYCSDFGLFAKSLERREGEQEGWRLIFAADSHRGLLILREQAYLTAPNAHQ
jgi:hypothetical protein